MNTPKPRGIEVSLSEQDRALCDRVFAARGGTGVGIAEQYPETLTDLLDAARAEGRLERAMADHVDAMRDEVIPQIERDLRDQAHVAARLRLGLPAEAEGAQTRTDVEPGLTPDEQKAQAARCGCKGGDDYCPCQNVADSLTKAQRSTVRAGYRYSEAVKAARTPPTDVEPVAWRLDEELTGTSFYDYKPDAEIDHTRFGGTLTPLYAHPPPTDAPGMSREAVEKVLADYFGLRPYAEMAADRADLRGKIRDGYDVNEPTKSDLADAADAILALASLGGRVGEDGSSRNPPIVDAVQQPAPSQDQHSDEGPGYDAGSTVWHSSEEDGGPDVGIQVGLGGGFSLYAGEVATSELEDHEIPQQYPDGWWLVLYGPSDKWIIGAVPDQYVAQEALEHLAGLVQRGLSGAQRSELSTQLRDAPLPSPSPVRGAGEED